MKTVFTLFFGVLLVSTNFAQIMAPAVIITKDSKTHEINGVFAGENLIKNGDFDLIKADGSPDLWGGWIDSGWGDPWKVIDGAVAITSLKENVDEQWHIQFNQTDLGALPDIPYTLSFVAWGSEDRAAAVDFEDTQANGYRRYGTSTDPEAIKVGNGSSEWHFNVTTTPKRFTFHVIFDQMVETTVQKIQFMLTQDLGTVYLDSISLVADIEVIEIDEINLTGGEITTDNGTLQIVAEILPVDATQTIKWSVAPAEGSTGRATISDTGLLTAVLNGKVTVTAMSSDDFIVSTVDVEISGQVVTEDDLNVVKNGKFDILNSDGLTAAYWEGWTDASPKHVVSEGVSVHTPVGGTANTWQYQFIQKNLKAFPDIDYLVGFTAWADVERSINIDFEDAPNSNTRYGASPDPEAIGGGLTGRSDWIVNITKEPKNYVLHVNFDKILPTTVQQIAFFLGKFELASTVYLDNISLISVDDMALLTSITQNKFESVKVYPNPVANKLHVVLPVASSKVAIYNIAGVKMEETNLTGTHHVFDVGRYIKGIYFVKANNTVVKFVK